MPPGDTAEKFWQYESTLSNVALRLDYVDLCGDLATGLLLSQIVYWFRPKKTGGLKLKVNRGGRLWLVKRRDDWYEECRISLKQYRRAVKVLEGLGVIEVELHKFNGVPASHIWLNIARLAHLLGSAQTPQSVEPKGHSGLGPKGTMGKAQKAESITETTTETTAATTKATEVAGEAELELQNALAKLKAKQQEPATGKSTATSLSFLWKKRMGLLSDGNYQKPLTSKEMGQLKHLLKALGDDCLGVVDWALQNWATFAWEARQKKGLANAPTVPVVGFLLEHHDIAINCMTEPAAKPVLKAVTPIDKPTQVKETAEPDKAGAADIAATLAALDKLGGS